ncbi:hypothetical protein QTP88_006332 [Uroleucon formosanum]
MGPYPVVLLKIAIFQTLQKNTRTSSDALTPPYTSKNRFSPLLTIQVDDNTDGIANEVSTQQSQVRPKIPPIYVYNISDYENFHTSLANITFDEFSIANTKSALKVNMDSIDDYRTATKLFDDSGTEYHTYQFPENKQLSVIIRNLPVNMSEACIYKELVELKFEVASVTRLQNKFKTPIPIVAILLSKSSTEIYSLNRLLHCVSLEAVAVLIKLNNRYVTIVSAYQPPSRQMQMSDYDKVMNLDNSIIMAGDLNAKHTNWGCRVINPNGTKLLSFIANTPYTNYAPNEPTYFPSDVNRQPVILDILLIKSFPLICTQEALAELDSDHIPVHKLLDLPDYSVQNCMDYVTPNEVKLIVKNLPNKKSPGHDHLTNLMFKKLPAKGIVLMTSLFNFLLRVGHFPLSWKIATIILIKKPGENKSNPDSYRPISLLTSLSKIFEKVIHTRLLNYLNSAEVIPEFQFGFRPNHSTIQQLFRITEHISNSFEKHCHTGAVFIDVSKAFDKEQLFVKQHFIPKSSMFRNQFIEM